MQHATQKILRYIIRQGPLSAAILGMGSAALQWSALNTILPVIQHNLHLSLAQLQWMMNIYGIFVCSTLVIWGHYADQYGHRKIFMLGLVIFLSASLLCAQATGAKMLIAGQFLVGLSAGALLPVSQAILTHNYPPQKINQALGLWATSVGLCLAFGPMIGAALAHALGWRSLFYITMLAAGVAIAICCLAIKPSQPLHAKKIQHDIKGASYLLLALSLLVLTLDQLHSWGIIPCVILLFCSLMCVYLLIRTEQQASMPIIDYRLLLNRDFLVASVFNLCLFLCLWPMFFLIPLYLHNVMHYGSLLTGAIMLSISIPVVIFALITKPIYRKFGAYRLIAIGFGWMLVSALLITQWGPTSSMLAIVASTAAFGLAWSFIWSPSNIVGVSSLPPHKAGLAAGSFITFQEFGGTLGLASIVSLVRRFPSLHSGMQAAAWVFACIAILALALGLMTKRS